VKASLVRIGAAMIMLLCALGVGGCASVGGGGSEAAPSERGASDRAGVSEPVVFSRDAWEYENAPGEVIRTRHYRIFTTETDPNLTDRLPLFLEAALRQYRTALGPLPPPPMRLDTYLMDNRPQWQRLTLRLLGPAGRRLSGLGRGGMASRGIGMYFDIGLYDTLSIAAHEGWHQYTQRTFRDPLPVWLEEGLATHMEGHRWDGARPMFLPWANVERFDALRRAADADALIALPDLVEIDPQERLSGFGRELPGYYAQVWALTHFLTEGEGGAHRAGLRAMLADAADGRLLRTIAVRLGADDASRLRATRRGDAALRAYVGRSGADLAEAYERFVRDLASPGSRGPVVRGESPLRAEAAP